LLRAFLERILGEWFIGFIRFLGILELKRLVRFIGVIGLERLVGIER